MVGLLLRADAQHLEASLWASVTHDQQTMVRKWTAEKSGNAGANNVLRHNGMSAETLSEKTYVMATHLRWVCLALSQVRWLQKWKQSL